MGALASGQIAARNLHGGHGLHAKVYVGDNASRSTFA
jgi:hypothetical protein